MKPITTWYKKDTKGNYYYSHFTAGHTVENKYHTLHKNCFLNTKVHPIEVIEEFTIEGIIALQKQQNVLYK